MNINPESRFTVKELHFFSLQELARLARQLHNLANQLTEEIERRGKREQERRNGEMTTRNTKTKINQYLCETPLNMYPNITV